MVGRRPSTQECENQKPIAGSRFRISRLDTYRQRTPMLSGTPVLLRRGRCSILFGTHRALPMLRYSSHSNGFALAKTSPVPESMRLCLPSQGSRDEPQLAAYATTRRRRQRPGMLAETDLEPVTCERPTPLAISIPLRQRGECRSSGAPASVAPGRRWLRAGSSLRHTDPLRTYDYQRRVGC